ncbi:MAG: dTDP-4-amino-4,6-dideoxyglucose formyltransferase [Crocinitomicaceae bacterium]|nr:dTDP-4-amino-4,6-dideoxyglucose formyltransferase [Crocinitomicaceae bacterium]
MKKVLVISDNEGLLNRFRQLLEKKDLRSRGIDFEFAFSYFHREMLEKFKGANWIKPINVKEDWKDLIVEYNMVFSLHCKQLFPNELVSQIKCINIHPGLNPFNRGWFPQVFSIINGLPLGATVHEIDTELDHGPIICQKEVEIESWDTSLTAYEKVLDAEMELLDQYLELILEENYSTFLVKEGNLNLKKDFDELCELNLDEKDSFQNHINKLRALTHGEYSNAYFYDKNGKKVYVTVQLKREES